MIAEFKNRMVVHSNPSTCIFAANTAFIKRRMLQQSNTYIFDHNVGPINEYGFEIRKATGAELFCGMIGGMKPGKLHTIQDVKFTIAHAHTPKHDARIIVSDDPMELIRHMVENNILPTFIGDFDAVANKIKPVEEQSMIKALAIMAEELSQKRAKDDAKKARDEKIELLAKKRAEEMLAEKEKGDGNV
jgi:hypothetical protein